MLVSIFLEWSGGGNFLPSFSRSGGMEWSGTGFFWRGVEKEFTPKIMEHIQVWLGSGEECGGMWHVNSEMAGPNRLKLGGLIEDICKNVPVRVRGGMIHDS